MLFGIIMRFSPKLYVFAPYRVELSEIPIHEYPIGYKKLNFLYITSSNNLIFELVSVFFDPYQLIAGATTIF
jgi:hypothetical protein